MSSAPENPSTHVTPGSVAIVAVLMAALWMLLVGTPSRDEIIVGIFSVIVSAFLFFLVARVRHQHPRFTARDLLAIRHVPVDTVSDLGTLTLALLRSLSPGAPAPASVFRVCGFRTSKRDPADIARRVLVTAYTSATPNGIVIGVDPDQSRLLIHQLVPAPISPVMRDLGARG